MNLASRWRRFILPYLHKLMETVRNDPDTTYDEWKKITDHYKQSVGTEY